MNKTRLTLRLLAMSVFALACVSLAQAQATRTWVSGFGDDAFPCSRTAPCKTFAGAISKTAAGGEIDALDAGGFGAVTLTKSITLEGLSTLAAILSSGTNGITVNVANTDKVVLRNLSINGSGTGINGINWINAGGTLIVENVEIERVTASGILMNLTNSGNLTVSNSRINKCGSTDNVDAAIRITTTSGTARATIANTTMAQDRVGVNVGERSLVFVRNSAVTGHQAGVVGLPVGYNITSATASKLFLDACTANNVNSGVRSVGNTVGTTQQIFMANCDIFNNTTGINIGPNSEARTYGNNRITRNGQDVSGTFLAASPGQR